MFKGKKAQAEAEPSFFKNLTGKIKGKYEKQKQKIDTYIFNKDMAKLDEIKEEFEKKLEPQKSQAEQEQAKASQRQPEEAQVKVSQRQSVPRQSAPRLRPTYAYAGAGAIGGAALGGGRLGGRRMSNAPAGENKWDRLWNPQKVDNAVNRIIVQPIQGIGSNAGSFMKYLLILLLIVFTFYLLSPAVKNYGAIGLGTILKGIGWTFTTGMEQFFANMNCAMGGYCPPPVESTDNIEYGITLLEIYTLQTKFSERQNIEVKTRAQAILLKDMNINSCATVDCALQDGTLISKSHDCIPLKEISKVTITCTYEPMVSEDSRLKEAAIGLSYQFKTEASLPLAMVSPTEYQAYIDNAFETATTLDDAEKEVARRYGVVMVPPANPLITPLVIGAEIGRNQPIPVGDKYTTLLVTVSNKGNGNAIIEDISVDLPSGVSITHSTELNYGSPTPVEGAIDLYRSIFNKDNLQSLNEEMTPGVFRTYDFTLDTSGFQLSGTPNTATTRKIYITVDYKYNTTTTKYITVTTCDEIGGCEEKAAEQQVENPAEQPVEEPTNQPTEQPAEVV